MPPSPRRHHLVRAIAIIGGLFALASTALPAQAARHPLVGKWDIEYEGSVTVRNGERTVQMVQGTLDVTAVGDSLVAVVRSAPEPGRPPRPDTRMVARRVDGAVTFQRKAEANIQVNGEARTVEVLTNWTLEAKGNALSGSFVIANAEVLPPGFGGGSPRTVKGTRAAS